MHARWICSVALVASAAAVPNTTTPYNTATACAIVSSSASVLLSASPKATPFVDAQLGYDCLNSVSLHAPQAESLVKAILPFIEWQSTIEYLKAPPAGYQEPAVDLRAGFAAVLANITSGVYKTEYEFQARLWNVFNSAHDGHFRLLPDLLSKAIGFRRPFPLVSVSLDGRASPKVYSYRDILVYQNSTFKPSALATIDGQKATKYIEDISQLGALQDPDALYNSMFFSPGFAAEASTWQGYFAGTGRFGWIYPGPKTQITFENGTAFTIENKAAVIGNFSGVVDGETFYKKFCTGPTPTASPNATTSSTPTPTATAVPIPNGYPAPIFISADEQVSGYYLPDSDVAVLSMLSFSPDIPAQFQEVVQRFFAAAKADGKTKLVIDLAANGGGLIFQGHDTFRQLFPQIVQDGNTRFRDTPALMAVARAISGAIPPGFDPYTSSDDDLINLYESVPNYRFDYNVNNKHFSSLEEKFGPRVFNGDNFTSIIRWNFDDDLLTINETYGVGEYITGYGPRTNFTQPFAAEDIVMIYDGYCASTCTLFSEFMRVQAGVKSIAYGGRSNTNASTPLIQAVGGVKGANNYPFTYIASLAREAMSLNVSRADRAILLPYTNVLPYNRSTDTSLNVRDNILQEDLAEGIPTQFLYEPADCRLFYTPQMMRNVTAIWEAAAKVTWGGGKCNAGGFNSTTSSRRRRSAKKHVKREMQVVDFGRAKNRNAAWNAQYVMTVPK